MNFKDDGIIYRSENQTLSCDDNVSSKHYRPKSKVGMMLVECASCGEIFNSNFSISEFNSLSVDQLESGTLHLCNRCGHLGLYKIRDYKDST
jgi:DNA-directed RNA polymerase subunit RPC12/RpoP